MNYSDHDVSKFLGDASSSRQLCSESPFRGRRRLVSPQSEFSHFVTRRDGAGRTAAFEALRADFVACPAVRASDSVCGVVLESGSSASARSDAAPAHRQHPA